MAESIMGRPTKYDPDIHPAQVESLAGEGLTNIEIAERMGIATSTLSEWKNRYDDFSDAISAGKAIADDRVEQSLYKRAIGYYITERKTVDDGHSVKIETTEKWVNDPTSIIFFLKNRRPEKWRDKLQSEISGPDGAPLTLNLIRTDFKQKFDE